MNQSLVVTKTCPDIKFFIYGYWVTFVREFKKKKMDKMGMQLNLDKCCAVKVWNWKEELKFQMNTYTIAFPIYRGLLYPVIHNIALPNAFPFHIQLYISTSAVGLTMASANCDVFLATCFAYYFRCQVPGILLEKLLKMMASVPKDYWKEWLQL